MMRPQPAKRSALRLILLLAFCSVLAPGAATAAAQAPRPSVEGQSHALVAEKLFQQASRSVFVVEALGSDGKVLNQGSGVVVAHEGVVTNRHVLERAVSIRIRRGTQIWAAAVEHTDPEHDLVQLRVPNLTAPPVQIRPSTSLQTGERVYAIGAPQGLELTLSEGLISSLRPYEGVQLIQTTAPISTGSSGGGLFDTQGRLIGITTFQVKEGQNLNFALPGEWVVALPTHAATPPMAQGTVPALNDPLVWFYLGSELLQAQAWGPAVSAFQEAIRLKPDYADAWSGLAVGHMGLGQDAQAIPFFREALRLKPGAEAWGNLGQAYHMGRQWMQAIAAYREALRLKPDNATNWKDLGGAYGMVGQHAEAVAAYREAVRLRSNYAEAWYGLGTAYYSLRQHGEAVTALREALRLKPELSDAWMNLGIVYMAQGQAVQGITAFREALRLKPDNANAWFNLGGAYGLQRQYAEAITAHREGLRLKPDDAEAWFSLGVVYAAQGDRAGVGEVHRQLKSLDPALAAEFFRRVVLP